MSKQKTESTLEMWAADLLMEAHAIAPCPEHVICACATAITPSTTLCRLQSIVSSQAKISGNEGPLLSVCLMAWVMSARPAYNLHNGRRTLMVSPQPQYLIGHIVNKIRVFAHCALGVSKIPLELRALVIV